MDPSKCDTLSHILGVKNVDSKEKYLGSPMLIGKSKVKSFEDINTAFERRLSNWQGGTMCQARRGTMVKVVLNVVPTYQMSTFKIPNKLIKKLDSLHRKFFWGYKTSRGNNHIAWSELCLPKEIGGLAFRDLEKLNQDLLTKMAWGICTQSELLCVRVLKAKYFKDKDFLHIQQDKSKSSWVWRGIEDGLKNLQQNICMEVYNGKKTRIWLDKWIINLRDKHVPSCPNHLQYEFLSGLISSTTNNWNLSLLHILYSTNVVDKITRMQVNIHAEDTVRWIPKKDGVFTIKSAYNKLTEENFCSTSTNTVPKDVWKALWKMKLPHRVKLFIWKCLRGIVQTKDKTTRFNSSIQEQCGICNHQVETLFHLLLVCRHARLVWRSLNVNVDGVTARCASIKEWIISWFSNPQSNGAAENNTWRMTLMVGCWVIWKERCEHVFQNKTLNYISTVTRIQFHLQDFSYVVNNSLPEQTQDITEVVYSPDITRVFLDASFDYLTNSSGTGMVLLSCAGTYDGAKGSYANRVIDPEAAECMAILEAISWIKALNIDEVQIITDAEIVVHSIVTDKVQVRWENNNLISRIKSMVSSFKFCKISHVKRDFNSIADCVVKKVGRHKLILEEYKDYSPWLNSLFHRLAVPRTA